MTVDLSDLPVMPLDDNDALGEVSTDYDPAVGRPPEPLPPDSRVIAPPDVPPPGWVPPAGTTRAENPRGWPGETSGRTRRRIKHMIETRLWEAHQAEQAEQQAKAQRAAEQAIADQAATATARASAGGDVQGPLALLTPPVGWKPPSAPAPDAPPSNDRPGSVHRNFRLPADVDRTLNALAQYDHATLSQEVALSLTFRERMLTRGAPGTGRCWALVDDGVILPPGARRVIIDVTMT